MDVNSNLSDCTDTSAVITSRDEVDFVTVSNNNNYNDKFHNDNKETNTTNNVAVMMEALNASSPVQDQSQSNNAIPHRSWLSSKTGKKAKLTNDMNGDLNKVTKKERSSLFSFTKKFSHKASKDEPDKKTKEDNNKCKAGSNLPLSVPIQPPPVPIGTPPRQQKFVKNSSIARLLGNSAYHAKTFDRDDQKRMPKDGKFKTYGGRRRPSGPYLDRFRGATKDDSHLTISKNLDNTDDVDANSLFLTNSEIRENLDENHGELVRLAHFHENQPEELNSKAFRTFSRNLGRKLWWKRSQSVNISTPDPEFKVSYLGNVLTGWAKGEGCVEKQLNTLWRNYTQNSKPDVIMRIKVCASGLKATTRQHGLTEYWANRITHCCAPKNYPRVFCWIYRHEGRKLKHELRCHAVLCSKEKIVQDICNTLKENLESALREFKREKILRQNARLSLANAVYDNPSLPRRKIMLSVGGNNYRPPLERSKSAPKLMAIEEAIGEEDGEEIEETNEPEMKSCCQKDSLYPAMTLGRRRCRRGHSIRRTGKARPCFLLDKHHQLGDACCANNALKTKDSTVLHTVKIPNSVTVDPRSCEQKDNFGSDDSDDFEKLLKQNDYDTKSSLANELLPYFDLQLNKKLSSSLGSLSELKCVDEEPLSLSPTINSHPSADPEADFSHALNDHDEDDEVVGLRRNGICSDGEEDYLDADETAYFRQTAILNMLHRNSMRKMAHLSLSSDENSSIDTNNSASLQYSHQLQSSISSNASSTATYSSGSCSASTSGSIGNDNLINNANELTKQVCQKITPDSDEGSISSGCETASTVTANQDDISLQSHQHDNKTYERDLSIGLEDIKIPSEHGFLDEELPITVDEIYQRLECRLQKRHNSDATTFSSSSSNTLKVGSSSSLAASVTEPNDSNGTSKTQNPNGTRLRRSRRSSLTQRAQIDDSIGDHSDSDYSDESGYVEYQERNKSMKPIKCNKTGVSIQLQQHERHNASKQQVPPKPMPRRSLTVDNNRSNNINSVSVSAAKTTTAV